MRCAACSTEIHLAPGERVGFRESCTSCSADLHSCVNCLHHDPSAYNECRENSAERVLSRERANRCEWFSAGEQAGGDAAPARNQAINDLESLFKK